LQFFIPKRMFGSAYQEPGSGAGYRVAALDEVDGEGRVRGNLVEGRADRSGDARCACGAYLSRYGNGFCCAPCESKDRQRALGYV
jgi:hypothetical protein